MMAKKQLKPKIALDLTLTDRLLEALAALFAILVVAVPIAYYGELPERIPRHFDIAGQVDSHGPKHFVLIVNR
ncbi:MAG: DUF1648 domain-containing protein [Saprospiraceae bacterium]|nr:DUF1648 domain-containing protein [Saprospiraceae bacterium]MDW8483403.1 DUF1648 domain-containing protein [Saprospiraceae bacterium]